MLISLKDEKEPGLRRQFQTIAAKVVSSRYGTRYTRLLRIPPV